MEDLVIDNRYVSLLIHSDEIITQGKAEELVRSALTLAGLKPWHGMQIELFPGRGNTLLMASPLGGCSIVIADYALPFLGLFTE